MLALDAVDASVAAVVAATNCTSPIVKSLSSLEAATCGDDGLVVGIGVYFETVCGVAAACTLCYLAWSVTPVGQWMALNAFLNSILIVV